MPAANSPALSLVETPTLSSAMTSLQAHPRRFVPRDSPLHRRTLCREDTYMPLPEDFIHVAGQPPMALHVEAQWAEDSDFLSTRIGTSRGAYDSQPVTSSRPPWGAFRRPYTTRSPTHLQVDAPGATAPNNDCRTNQRRDRDFLRHRYREGRLESDTRPSQRSPRLPDLSLVFQQHHIGQTQGRLRSASPDRRLSRRTRHRSTSDDGTIVVAPSGAPTLEARCSHPYSPQPKEVETEPGHPKLPPPYFSIPSGSSDGVLVKLGNQLAPTIHVIRVPTAPQADPSQPPPPYSPRDPQLHPTASDYDLTRDRNRYHRHNNDAPPLPLYTPLAGAYERVLQFGGSGEEQRNAFARLLQEGDNMEKYVGLEELGQQREEELLPLPSIEQEEDQDMDMDMEDEVVALSGLAMVFRRFLEPTLIIQGLQSPGYL